MQKRWNILVFVLAFVMLVTSAFAEGELGKTEPAAEAGAAQTESVKDSASAAGKTAQDAPTNTPIGAPVNTPVNPTSTPIGAPVNQPTANPTTAPAATPTVQPTSALTEAPAATPLATAEPAAPARTPKPSKQQVWVALSVDMGNLTNSKADVSQKMKAEASLRMAQFLLARAVTDGKAVGLYQMQDRNSKIFSGTIASQADWDALVQMIEKVSCRVDPTYVHESFGDFLSRIKADVERTDTLDLWMLHAYPTTKLTLQKQSTIQELLNRPGFQLHFRRFQEADSQLKDGEDWLDQKILKIQDLNTDAFAPAPFFYQEVAQDPLAMAVEIFGLNLCVPYTPVPDRDEDGLIPWVHEGHDTLLVLKTKGKVSIASETQEAGRGFPLVMKMSDTQYMVLLRGVDPGVYLIRGEVEELQANYAINAKNALVIKDGGNKAKNPGSWNREDKQLDLELKLPQVYSLNDIQRSVYIKGLQSTEEVLLAVQSEDVSSDGDAVHRWKVTIPRQNDDFVIRFVVKVGGVEIAQRSIKVYLNEREVKLKDGQPDCQEIVSYYNVPGQGAQETRVPMEPFFDNPDGWNVTYTLLSDNGCVDENGVLVCLRGEGVSYDEYVLRVADGISENPLAFTVKVTYVDFNDLVQGWHCNGYSAEGQNLQFDMNEEIAVSFTLPAEVAQAYQALREQYGALPENITDALTVSCKMSDSNVAEPAELAVQEDGSLLMRVTREAYGHMDVLDADFSVFFAGVEIPNQTLFPKVKINVINDTPILAEGVEAALTLKGKIQGMRGSRTPLTMDQIELAPHQYFPQGSFVPESLFVDHLHEVGLTVTIQAEPAELARLLDGQGQEVAAANGVWVIPAEVSGQPYRLEILDKGSLALTITADDGEFTSEAICWTLSVKAPMDELILIAIIAVAALAILLAALLVLREVRKPSFAKMDSKLSMGVYTKYTNDVGTAVPLAVYGKKETDLARLFIACQQLPLASLPMDVLADIALQPWKRNSYRLVLGRHAGEVNILVADYVQSKEKPVVFGANQKVSIFVEQNERLELEITSDK